jgi:hypothetical protein
LLFCGARTQIIQVNLTSENPQPIVPGVNVEFTYAVRWAPSAIPFPRRFERYLDYNFFEHQARAHAPHLMESPLCHICAMPHLILVMPYHNACHHSHHAGMACVN